MQIFITGANFVNKGAQSMLFTTVAVLRHKYPDVKIFFAHANKTPVLNGNFLFEEVYFYNNLINFPFGKKEVTPPHGQSRTFLGIRRQKHLTQ